VLVTVSVPVGIELVEQQEPNWPHLLLAQEAVVRRTQLGTMALFQQHLEQHHLVLHVLTSVVLYVI
jgi:hypothetical protein